MEAHFRKAYMQQQTPIERAIQDIGLIPVLETIISIVSKAEKAGNGVIANQASDLYYDRELAVVRRALTKAVLEIEEKNDCP